MSKKKKLSTLEQKRREVTVKKLAREAAKAGVRVDFSFEPDNSQFTYWSRGALVRELERLMQKLREFDTVCVQRDALTHQVAQHAHVEAEVLKLRVEVEHQIDARRNQKETLHKQIHNLKVAWKREVRVLRGTIEHLLDEAHVDPTTNPWKTMPALAWWRHFDPAGEVDEQEQKPQQEG